MPNINLCSPVRRVVAPTKNCTGKIASGANFRAAWCLIDKCTVIDFSCLDLCVADDIRQEFVSPVCDKFFPSCANRHTRAIQCGGCVLAAASIRHEVDSLFSSSHVTHGIGHFIFFYAASRICICKFASAFFRFRKSYNSPSGVPSSGTVGYL